MKIVPKEWMPNCSMKRVIIQWDGETRTVILG